MKQEMLIQHLLADCIYYKKFEFISLIVFNFFSIYSFSYLLVSRTVAICAELLIHKIMFKAFQHKWRYMSNGYVRMFCLRIDENL